MCGINGIIGLSAEESKPLIQKMNDRLAHRGPNDEGLFAEDGIALGHRRLSIIDLSSAGHQPMEYDTSNYAIVFNGELYNFKEIKNEIQKKDASVIFKTNTDTEVILAAYKTWGTDCIHHFNGMFAVAIYDKVKQQVFFARDRIGKKPLYYFQKENLFLFSSEIRSLLSTNMIYKQIDKESLADFLRYQTVHAPKTIIKDVHMLMPGHFATYNIIKNTFSPTSYWNIFKKHHPTTIKNYTEICDDIHSLLLNSVKRRLIADVPFGAFLSGGIDSSAVVALMTQVSTAPVKTFAVTFDEKQFDESTYSNLIAKRFNTVHHEIKLSVDDFKTELPNALNALDHPSGDGPNTYVVTKHTKEAGVTMALSGLGGDELFAGYEIFTRTINLKNYQWLNYIPASMKSSLGYMMKTFKPGVSSEKIKQLLKGGKLNFQSTYHLSRQVLLDEQILKLLHSDALPANAAKNIIAAIEPNDKILSQVSIAEMATYMQNVLLRDTDQMSMAHALEVRVPFLDHELIEYVFALPDSFKYPVTPKKLLVDSLKGLLPNEIIDRPKMGFTFPWSTWMKNELKGFCEERIHSIANRSVFNKNEVLKLWEHFLNDDPKVTWSRVWCLIVLENWLNENNID